MPKEEPANGRVGLRIELESGLWCEVSIDVSKKSACLGMRYSIIARARQKRRTGLLKDTRSLRVSVSNTGSYGRVEKEVRVCYLHYRTSKQACLWFNP